MDIQIMANHSIFPELLTCFEILGMVSFSCTTSLSISINWWVANLLLLKGLSLCHLCNGTRQNRFLVVSECWFDDVLMFNVQMFLI